MTDWLAQLNPAQRQAAEHVEGPALIIAGAGSGKTRVLTSRIAHLIQNHGVAPNAILAVTFTNKAAQEMRERVEDSIGPIARVIWISTFHSTCLRILRRHAVEIGYENSFVVYDDTDQKTLIKQIIQELDMNERAFAPQAVQWAINAAKNEQMNAQVYSQQPLNFFQERVAQIYARYEKALMKNNAMDFADLINQTIRLFEEKPDVLRLYRRTFQHVMVDEYQDTNPAQYRLLSLLTAQNEIDSTRNLFVVGDEDQSIYGWRGADIRIILKFESDFPGAQVMRLEQNYRSTQVILSASNFLVGHNTERKGKTLWTDKKGGDKIVYCTSLDEHQEGAYIARKLLDLRNRQLINSFSDAAVFYRTNAQSRVIEEELRKQDIPYRVIGGTRFYDRAEIKDVLAYLHVLVNPQDSIHLLRIINRPARGIGGATIDKLVALAEERQTSIYTALHALPDNDDFTGAVRKKLSKFTDILRKSKAIMETTTSVAEIVRQVIEFSEYAKALEEEGTIESQSRLENISELLAGIEEYEQNFRPSEERPVPRLADFLDQVTLVNATDQVDLSAGQVNLMTIHLAKGLEFSAVFITGLEEGLFPHSRSLNEGNGVEEERRLCYVGMTRAKERLYLTNTARRRLYGADHQYNVASRFCEEIPEDLLERVSLMPAEAGYTPRPAAKHWEDDKSQTIDYSESQDNFQDSDFDSDQTASPFRVGMQVRHALFGVGVIRQTEGKADNAKVIVQFQGVGPKKLLVRAANLEVLRG